MTRLARMIGLLPWATWTRGQRWYFAVFAILLCVWPGIVYLRAGPNSLAIVIYWLTALVVLAYTVETYGMRQEMIRQNEIAIEPVVIAAIETRLASGPAGAREPRRDLVLRNIGKGPALFITIPAMRLHDVAGDRVPFTASFQPASFLEAGDECTLQAICSAVDSTTPGSYFDAVASLDPTAAIETVGFRIEYEDVTGQARMTVMQMGEDGIRLLEHRKLMRR